MRMGTEAHTSPRRHLRPVHVVVLGTSSGSQTSKWRRRFSSFHKISWILNVSNKSLLFRTTKTKQHVPKLDLMTWAPKIWPLLYACSLGTSVIPRTAFPHASHPGSCGHVWYVALLWGWGTWESVTQSHKGNMAGLPGAWIKPWKVSLLPHCVSQPSACLWDSLVKDSEKHWPNFCLCAEKDFKSVLHPDFSPKWHYLQCHINSLWLN